MIRNSCRGAAFVALALVSSASAAQSCNIPSPFDYLKAFDATAAWEGAAGTACTLRVNLANSANTPLHTGFASATLHTTLPRLRLKFHVDASTLAGLNTVRAATLVNLVAAQTPPLPGALERSASLAKVSLYGNLAGTDSRLTVVAGDNSAEGRQYFQIPTLPSTFDLGIEATVGVTGSVKIWIDNDFSAAPTVVLNVDNSDWNGVSAFSIGVLDPSSGFVSTYAGQDVLISGFKLDETLFLDSFD